MSLSASTQAFSVIAGTLECIEIRYQQFRLYFSKYDRGIIFKPLEETKRTHMKLRQQIIALLCISSATVLLSCKKEGNNSTLQVQLTDAPASYEEVNIDLRQVSVKFSKDTTKWVELTPKVGIYNLLGLQNGIDTLIGSITVPTQIVKEIRLVLGG